MRASWIFILSFNLLHVVPAQASYERPGRFSFAQEYHQDQVTLDLRGAGTLSYLKMFKVYVGALYLPPGVESDRVLDDVPKRLEVAYLRSMRGEDFGEITVKALADRYSAGELAAVEDRVASHSSLYRDVGPGDRQALTYLPGRGTVLELNGDRLGTIPGADFARVLFSLWLGPEPIDNTFKNALLGIR